MRTKERTGENFVSSMSQNVSSMIQKTSTAVDETEERKIIMIESLNYIEEKPLFKHEGCCPEFGQSICLYAADLIAAKVGDKWSCSDQDRYPNREHEWWVTVTVVYTDEDGVLLKVKNEEPACYGHEPRIVLLWMTVHGRKAQEEVKEEEARDRSSRPWR